MTTKTITGTYSAGYLLSTSFDAVSITASGSVGGSGLIASAFATVTNAGHLEASGGANGVTLGSGGGAVSNEGSGYIRGSVARASTGAGAAGRTGGAGAYLTVYGWITDNLGDIVGGAGGAGVAGTFGGAGGAGGAGGQFHAGGYVRNQGLMRGGVGGTGGAGSSTARTSGGVGGTGGAGVNMTATGTVVNYSAHIYGGAGGRAGVGAGHGDQGGVGGAGVYMAQGGYVEVYQGLTEGGVGGYGGANGGGGGAGVLELGAAQTVINFGQIVGGTGGVGGGVGAMGQYGSGGGGGGIGVELTGGGILVNQGTLRGGTGGAGANGAPGGPGGYGAFCTGDNTILNYGTLTSGVGGGGGILGHPKGGVFMYGGGVITNGASDDTHAFIGINTTGPTGATYGDGIFVGYSLYAVTVTNFGAIQGGSSQESRSVFFHPASENLSSPPTLVVEAGCAFIGGAYDSVYGGGQGVLVLASGVGTVSGFRTDAGPNQMIVSGSMALTTFTAFATLEIGDGASFTLAPGMDVPLPDGAFATNTLDIAGSATIAATLSVEGTIEVSGKLTGGKNSALVIDGGEADFFTGASLTAASVDVSDAAQVNVATNLTFTHTWDQSGSDLSVGQGDTLTFKGFGNSFSGTLSGTGSGGEIAFAPTAPATETLNGVTISAVTVEVTDASLVVGAAGATIASTGTVNFHGASADSFGGANTLTNAGLIETSNTAGTTIIDTVVNTGVLFADKGDLTLDAAVSGTGSAKIAGATLDFASGFTGNVTFTGGSGELELTQSQGYTGTITGFSKTGGTSLELGDIGFVSSGEATYSGNKSGGVLTVTDGMHTARIHLKGNYTGSTFIAASDGGGVLITDPAGGGGAAQPPPHAFIAAMAGLGAGLDGGLASHAMTAPRDIAASLLIPRVATA